MPAEPLGRSSTNDINIMRFHMDGGNQLVPAKGEYFVEYDFSSTLNDCTLQQSSDIMDDDIMDDNIWIYYQNVRSLRTKIDDLFLAVINCNYHVIIMTETGLDTCITSQQLFGVGFNVFRCDRSPLNSNKSRFGGVLIAVSHRYTSRAVHTISGQTLEQICVLSTIKGRRIFMCCTYIPPDKSHDMGVINSYISSINEICEKCMPGDVVLICGDFNQPRMRWCLIDNAIQCDCTQLPTSSSTLLDGMDYLCLNQRNLIRNSLNRILDLVFCSSDCLADVNNCTVPLLPVDSHHPPLEISLPMQTVRRDSIVSERQNERPLNFRKINFAALSEYLLTVDWNTIFNSNDVNEMAENFCSILNEWLFSNVPRARPLVSPAWSNSRLIALKRVRNACQRKLRHHRTLENKRRFQQASNAYRFMNATLYKSYVMRMQRSLRRNPHGFWRFVNSKRKSTVIPKNVYLEDMNAASAVDSSRLFTKHFASVFTPDSTALSEINEAIRDVPVDLTDVRICTINSEMVLIAAKKLKVSYSPGPDGLPSVVICRCIAVLAQPLCTIFNRSLQEAKFPSIWKQSFMTPVFKRGDRHNVANYRGITSLSAVSKLFETIVCRVIFDATKNYISSDQHGFMPGRSVTTNMLQFTSKCITSMEKKAQIDVIYTDLKAAFDKIDHKILLCKLTRLGISSQLVTWLKSYLTERNLRVKIDGCTSQPFSNSSGVPQGSNLGPLLFILFFNDATLVLKEGLKLGYADDLKLYNIVRNEVDCLQLQNSLTLFADWCHRNKLVISIEKCQIITFHRMINPILFDYHINGCTLSRVTRVTDLGILLDQKMTFDSQCSAIISKATRQLGFISKIAKDFSDPHCLKSLYCALVRPILENASIIWHPYRVTWNLRIERVQKRFIRLALRNLPWRNPDNMTPYPERCRLLGIDTLERRRKIQQVLFVTKLLNGEIDAPDLLSMVNFRVPSRLLRNTTLLQPISHRTVFGYNEPFSTCIRSFTSVEEFFMFDEQAKHFINRIRPLLY